MALGAPALGFRGESDGENDGGDDESSDHDPEGEFKLPRDGDMSDGEILA